MKTKEIKYWISKYSTYIISFLIAVILLKSCKSCTTEKRYEYNIKHKHELYTTAIDSLTTVIDIKAADNKLLLDSINILQHENKLLKTVVDDIKQDKEYYRKQNRNLANMAENLTKKDTIK